MSLTVSVICARDVHHSSKFACKNIVDMFFTCVYGVRPDARGRLSRVKHQFNINTLIDAPASSRSRLNFQSPRRRCKRRTIISGKKAMVE